MTKFNRTKSFIRTDAFKYIMKYNYVFILFMIIGTILMLLVQINGYKTRDTKILNVLHQNYKHYIDSDYYCSAVGCSYLYDITNKATIRVSGNDIDFADIKHTPLEDRYFMIKNFHFYLAINMGDYVYYVNISHGVYSVIIFALLMYLMLLTMTLYFTHKILNDERLSFIFNVKSMEASIKYEALHKIGYTAVHEMKTPLMVLSSILEEIEFDLKSDYSGRLSEDIRKSLSIGNDAVEQIYESLKSLDTYKVIEFSNGNKNMFMLIKSSLDMLSRTEVIKFSHMKIDQEFNKYRIDHSNGMTNGFFLNVLMNHIKNSLEAGASDINITINRIDKNRLMHIYIEDNGIGMPPDIAKSVFNLHVTTKNVNGVYGRGSGMYYNKTVLSADYGGDIKLIKTEQGKGTIFDIAIKCVDYKFGNK